MKLWKILTVANVVKRKRIDLCAMACSRLEQSATVSWKVIGRGSELERIREMAPGSMEFLDRVEDLTPFYKDADLFVLPSEDEGFGMVYIESIMCSCPVVCRRRDGGEEIVTTTGGGLAVDLPDSDEIAVNNLTEAIGTIMADRERFMSDEIVARAREMVDPGTIKEKWLDLLKQYETLMS